MLDKCVEIIGFLILVVLCYNEFKKEKKLINDTKKNYGALTNTLIKKKITIATMESCTSGLIASLITDVDGASKVFSGGYITYSNETKIKCGVSKDIIDTYGVYSKETAKDMARACKKSYGTDIGIGVTGSLGIVDSKNKDSVPGEVYFAIDYLDKVYEYHINILEKRTKFLNKVYVANYISLKILEIITLQ